MAGQPSLDFLNTRPVVRKQPVELLSTLEDFVRWLGRAGAIDSRAAADALRRWGDGPEGARIAERARSFRETLRHMVDGIVKGRGIPTEGLAAINFILAENDGGLRLERHGGGFPHPLHLAADAADRAARPRRGVRGGPARLARPAPHPPLRQPRLRPLLLRRDAQSPPPVVRDGDLREPHEGPGLPPTPPPAGLRPRDSLRAIHPPLLVSLAQAPVTGRNIGQKEPAPGLRSAIRAAAVRQQAVEEDHVAGSELEQDAPATLQRPTRRHRGRPGGRRKTLVLQARRRSRASRSNASNGSNAIVALTYSSAPRPSHSQ